VHEVDADGRGRPAVAGWSPRSVPSVFVRTAADAAPLRRLRDRVRCRAAMRRAVGLVAVLPDPALKIRGVIDLQRGVPDVMPVLQKPFEDPADRGVAGLPSAVVEPVAAEGTTTRTVGPAR
jgi:hypothetical protein